MARSKDEAQAQAIFGFLGFILLSVFLINSVCVFRHYDNKYDFREASARVTDTWNFTRFGLAVAGLGGFGFFLAMPVSSAIQEIGKGGSVRILAVLLACLPLWLLFVIMPALLISARIGTTQAGMLVYKQRGYFVIPTDWNKNTFTQNIFQLKIISAMYTMEALPLKEVNRITREGGKIALVHGNFGTRRIAWRNKQKRDECIAALENACGRRLGSYM